MNIVHTYYCPICRYNKLDVVDANLIVDDSMTPPCSWVRLSLECPTCAVHIGSSLDVPTEYEPNITDE